MSPIVVIKWKFVVFQVSLPLNHFITEFLKYHYSAIKDNEFFYFTTWMELEGIMLSERSQELLS